MVSTATNANSMKDGDFSKTLFVMGDFPAFSQTFILRELKEFEKRGIALRVIADREAPNIDLDPWLQELKGRTTYIRAAKSAGLGAIKGILAPWKLLEALRWALKLPHRSNFHRIRFITILLLAFDIAPWVKKHFNYIHSHFAAFQTELAMCLSHLTGVPWGATWHAYGIWKDKNLLPEKIADARVIMTCTQFNADHLKKLAPSHTDKIHLVYHGLDFNQFAEPVPIPPGELPRFTAVGRLIPKKGFKYLIDAVAILIKRQIPCHLTIVGDGDEHAALTRRIRQLGLARNVTMAGHCSNEEVMKCLVASRGLVAPSIVAPDGNIDGIPNVLLEAMMAGRPIIGTRMSGIPEVIFDGVNGYLVPSEDATALADAMQKICTDDALTQSMGAAGRRFVEKHFNVIRSVDEQIEILGNLNLNK